MPLKLPSKETLLFQKAEVLNDILPSGVF